MKLDILFQNIYTDSACQTQEKGSETPDCNTLATSAPNKKCEEDTSAEATKKCKESDILCSEMKTGSPTDDLCRTLKITGDGSENLLCIKDGTGCKTETKCDAAKGETDDACNKYPVVTKGNTCKKDTTSEENNCKEVKAESAKDGANNLKISLAFLISLILF